MGRMTYHIIILLGEKYDFVSWGYYDMTPM